MIRGFRDTLVCPRGQCTGMAALDGLIGGSGSRMRWLEAREAARGSWSVEAAQISGDDIADFDFAAGGRVPGDLYGSGPPEAPGCLLVAKRRVGAGLDWLEASAALWGAYPHAAPSHVGRSRPCEDGPTW